MKKPRGHALEELSGAAVVKCCWGKEKLYVVPGILARQRGAQTSALPAITGPEVYTLYEKVCFILF